MQDEGVGFPSEVVDAVRFIVNSDAWVRFFVPSLESINKSYVSLLIDPSKKREENYSDDYLRGWIAALNSLVDLPQALIAQADAQQAAREVEEAQAEHFRTRADLGTP